MYYSNNRFLIIILLLAFAFRTYHLASQPLSGDEAFTVTQWGNASVTELVNKIALIDPQPPLALLTFHVWLTIAGSTEFAARYLSAITSLLLTASTYGLARRFSPSPVPQLACLLSAINPFQIWYAQDARPYSMWVMLNAINLIAFTVALRKNTISAWLAYVCITIAGLYTFYFEAFSFITCFIIALIWSFKNRHIILNWITSQLLIALAISPWLLLSNFLKTTYQPTATTPDIPAALQALILGETIPQVFAIPLGQLLSIAQLMALFLAIVSIICAIFPHTHKRITPLILSTVIPIIILTLLTILTHKGFFRARYLAISSTPFLILIAYAITQTHTRKFFSIFSSILLTLCALYLSILVQYHFNPTYAKAPPWRQIVAVLQNEATSDDLIIQNYPDPAFQYYYKGSAAQRTLPSSENPPSAVTTQQLTPLPDQHRYIWFMRIDSPYYDRDHVVSDWLTDNTQYINDQWIGPVRLYQFATWQPSSRYIAHALTYTLQDIAILRGYDLATITDQATHETTLIIQLFWQPISNTTISYTGFVHLISLATTEIKLMAQDDHPPQQGRLSTTSWQSQSLIRDVYYLKLPPQLPTGSYYITTGFYDPTSQKRLPFPTNLPQPEPNALLIQIVTYPTKP